MNKFVLYFLTTLVIVAFAGCSGVLPENNSTISSSPECVVQVSLSVDAGKTKAPFLDVFDYEESVNYINVYIYDDLSGRLEKHSKTQLVQDMTFTLKAGMKKIIAIANYSIPDKEALYYDSASRCTIPLEANRRDPALGFVFTGETAVSVFGSSPVPCNISLRRRVCRIVLSSIRHTMPDQIVLIKYAFLSNVVGTVGLFGQPTMYQWYNKMGRVDEEPQNTNHIIDGSMFTASHPELTFVDINQRLPDGIELQLPKPLVMYCCPNSSLVEPDGFKLPFMEQKTMLVLVVSYLGRMYYYPCSLDLSGSSGNDTHTVRLTITGPGSDEPNRPIIRIEGGAGPGEWEDGNNGGEEL